MKLLFGRKTSDAVKGLAEVGDEIVRIFNADGKTDKVGCDPCRSELLIGELAVCGGGRVQNTAAHVCNVCFLCCDAEMFHLSLIHISEPTRRS